MTLGLLFVACSAGCSRGGVGDPDAGPPAAADLAPAAGDLGTDLARADRAPLAPVVPRFTLGAPFPAPGTYGGVAAADA